MRYVQYYSTETRYSGNCTPSSCYGIIWSIKLNKGVSMKRILFVLCMLVLLLPSVFAGGSQEKSDEITLKWQIWITPNLI